MEKILEEYDIEIQLNIIKNLSVVCKNWNYKLRIKFYWRACFCHKCLISDTWLIENKFEWIIESDHLEILYNYIKIDPNICIAGGYPTLMCFGKNLIDYPNSDIDIYIINKTVNSHKTLENLLKFIMNTYNKISFHMLSNCIVNIKIDSINRILQIILTDLISVMNILSSFDNSHNKCCYYLNKTLLTIDTLKSKNTKSTYFYIENPKLDRITKTVKLGLSIKNDFSINLTNSNFQKINQEYKYNHTYEFIINSIKTSNWKNVLDNYNFNICDSSKNMQLRLELCNIDNIKLIVFDPYNNYGEKTILFGFKYNLTYFNEIPSKMFNIRLIYNIDGFFTENSIMHNSFYTCEITKLLKIKTCCYDIIKKKIYPNENLTCSDHIKIFNTIAIIRLKISDIFDKHMFLYNQKYRIKVGLIFVKHSKLPNYIIINHHLLNFSIIN